MSRTDWGLATWAIVLSVLAIILGIIAYIDPSPWPLAAFELIAFCAMVAVAWWFYP